MKSVAEKIRAILRGKTSLRITRKTRNAGGYEVFTPNGTSHWSSLHVAQTNLLISARVAEKQCWGIRPVKKGGQK